MEPQHAAAHINLGTLYYNRQDFASAEKHYRAAVAADPRYALAYFDLGNVLDETGRVLEASTAEAEHAITLLAERYPQQRVVGAVLANEVVRWSGWTSG